MSEPKPSGARENENPKLRQFLTLLKNEIRNPPKSSDLFKIPKGLMPDWQIFFEKVAAYHERRCAQNRSSLIILEKRAWLMEDNDLSEFEMLVTAGDIM